MIKLVGKVKYDAKTLADEMDAVGHVLRQVDAMDTAQARRVLEHALAIVDDMQDDPAAQAFDTWQDMAKKLLAQHTDLDVDGIFGEPKPPQAA